MSDDVAHHISPAALEALEAEIEHLETEGRREMAERLRTARAWGDLKENSEYHDAKNAQAHLETRILQLRERRLTAVVVEPDSAGDVVALGSVVTVRDVETGKERTYTIVSSNESDPAKGLVGIDSPVGRGLAGARAGDVVEVTTPRGERRIEVLALGARA